MSSFIRRFLSDPGLETLLEIESVNILDLEPPASISGVGAGTALLIGEFENGPFAASEGGPQEVTSATDLLNRFGGFGYVYDGVQANNPCARKRFVDGAITPEFWNGNGFLALINKRFKRLLLARVDTTVGQVEFSRLPCLLGAAAPTYDLEPGDDLVTDTFTVAPVTTPFLATIASQASGAGVYPTLFVGGEQIVLLVDENTPNPIGPVTVTFQATDQTQADVIARVNAAMGYTAWTLLGGGVTRMDGRVRGLSGSVRAVSADVAVFAATGFGVGVGFGTGNVANIDLVTVPEVDAILNVTTLGAIRARVGLNGQIELCNIAVSLLPVLFLTGGSAAIKFGFTAGPVGHQGGSLATLIGTGGVYPPGPSGFVGGETFIFSHGDVSVMVVFTALDQTAAQVAAAIDTAAGYGAAFVSAGGQIVLIDEITNAGEQTSLVVSGGTGATTIGFAGPYPMSAGAEFQDSTIPAGTRVRNSSGDEWVTAQTVATQAATAGPYVAKVRPAVDDGTTGSAGPLTVTVLPFPVQGGFYKVTNPLALTAALTEAQIDARYSDAIATTTNLNNVSKETNVSWGARQSNVVRNLLRTNAVDASANGCFGRIAIIRPPLGTTTRALAGGNSPPGVGALRDQRVVYAFPGVQTFSSQIASRGLAGGAGFTADGVIDVGFDGFIVSICSQLPPEENPGQETVFAFGALAIEAGNADVQNLEIGDYINFRKSGIAAPRFDNGLCTIQSGVTSVNPLIFPNLRNIARRRMADFIEDSLAQRLKAFGKKLNSRSRRAVITQEVRAFMQGLTDSERIDGYLLDAKSGNTQTTLALGMFRIIDKVRTLSSLDSIVLEVTAGESVDVAEAA